MKRLIPNFLGIAIVMTAMFPPALLAGQHRRVVVRPVTVVVRRPVVRTPLVVHRGYPLRRVLPTAVVVRPARRAVVVSAPLVFLPGLVWRPTVVAMPPSTRLVWQDSESITRDEGWVDTNFGVDESGNALFLDINGKAGLNFAEVTFVNGNVQVVDFNEQTHDTGIYKLLDFADGRRVMTVRLLAKSESERDRS